LGPKAASFAQEIKQAREALRLTQEQWAKRLGVSTRTISRWESGEVEPNTAAQKATVTQAIHAAGLAGTFPTLAGLAAAGVVGMMLPGLAAPGFGVAGLVASAAAAAARQKSRARGLHSARNRLRVLDAVVTSAESLGIVPEVLATAELALLDAALMAGLTLAELRELVVDEMGG
jgi:transcriptional regulator with XRE-family HTH domain